MKLVPVATGTTIEKVFVDKALNIDNADMNIKVKARITGSVKIKPTHSLKVCKTLFRSVCLIKTVPATLNTA